MRSRLAAQIRTSTCRIEFACAKQAWVI